MFKAISAAGLAGWQTLVDVSAQTAGVGLAPTQGVSSAFVTKMAAGENPFSGVASPQAGIARQFLGLPAQASDTGPNDFLAVMPPLHLTTPGGASYAQPDVGESGAMNLRFYVDAPSVVSFDWNKIGRDGDAAFFSLWADDASGYRLNDWLSAHPDYLLPFGPSGVDLCARTPQYCGSDFNVNGETGWQKRSITVNSAGWLLGFALGEVAEGTVPSVLALDNLQLQPMSELPEPGTVALVASAQAAVAVSRKRARAAQ